MKTPMIFIVNDLLSNVFNFKQYIIATYAQFGSKIDKFSYLLGLRMENTRTTLDQPTSGDFKRKKSYWAISNYKYKF